ncbi:hypothetical protein [Azohydromonas australica]
MEQQKQPFLAAGEPIISVDKKIGAHRVTSRTPDRLGAASPRAC